MSAETYPEYKSRRWFGVTWRSLNAVLEGLIPGSITEDLDFWPGADLSPPLDVIEGPDALEVRMELPGMNPSDIDIQIDSELLTISGTRRKGANEQGESFYHRERHTGSFSRSVEVRSPIKEQEGEARLANGILTIRLPKAPVSAPRRIVVGK